MIKEEFSNPIYEERIQVAERELSAFIGAVAELFGPEQARRAAEDWLDELELMDRPPRDWRAVTIAASARLAHQLNLAQHNGMSARRSETRFYGP